MAQGFLIAILEVIGAQPTLRIDVAHNASHSKVIEALALEKIPDGLFIGSRAGACGASHLDGGGCAHLIRVVHPGQLAMLGPGAGIVPTLGTHVGHSGDLHLVLPFGGALHRQTVTNVDADVAGAPDRLTQRDAGEISGHAGAHLDGLVSVNVLHAVGGVLCAAVGCAGVAAPAPQDALDKTHAVKAVHRGALVSGSLNHGRAVSILVIGVIVAVAGDIPAGERCAKTAQHIQGLVIFCDVHGLVNQGPCFHFCHLGPP